MAHEAPWAVEGIGTECQVATARGLPHVYSEAARIRNPIHTERAAALAAGESFGLRLVGGEEAAGFTAVSAAGRRVLEAGVGVF